MYLDFGNGEKAVKLLLQFHVLRIVEIGCVATAQGSHLIHEQLRHPNYNHCYLCFVLRLQTIEFLETNNVFLFNIYLSQGTELLGNSYTCQYNSYT